jgi:hypothetical protein
VICRIAPCNPAFFAFAYQMIPMALAVLIILLHSAALNSALFRSGTAEVRSRY